MARFRLGALGAISVGVTLVAGPVPAQPTREPAPTPAHPVPPAPEPQAAKPSAPPQPESAEAEATPAPTAAATSTATALPQPAPLTTAQADPEPPSPKRLSIAGDGFLKFGALLQFWGLLTAQDNETATTFRVRRAELKFSGEVLPKWVAYKVMIDPAKVLESEDATVPVEGQEPEPEEPGTVTVSEPSDKLSVFQDFAITFLSNYADVSLGQFKNGLSFEGFTSSSKLLLPERAPVSREYGDERDIGVSVEKQFEHVNYFVGLFNGPGLNLRDDNNQKDLAVRLELLPTSGLLLGAVGYTSLGQRDQPTTRDRVEADVRLDLANVLVQAEYLRGWDGPSGARVQGQGFYAALGYTFLSAFQPVVRLGQLDTDLDANAAGDDDELMHYDVGFNYFIDGSNARLSASASIFDFDEEPTQTDVILMAQAAF